MHKCWHSDRSCMKGAWTVVREKGRGTKVLWFPKQTWEGVGRRVGLERAGEPCELI